MKNIKEIIKEIEYDSRGLVPVVVQDKLTKSVLMLAYMNNEAIEETVTTGQMCYYSRSRKQLWRKGETSGNTQKLVSLKYDCDKDALLAVVHQKGPACHTGAYTCFHNEIKTLLEESFDEEVLPKLYSVIENRVKKPVEGSYTNYLLKEGVDKILKKVGEESAEVIIAAKNRSRDELKNEISDLVYHVLVLMVEQGLTLKEVEKELESRYK
jgi:phosphoribosyl-ATP pyrophosphohydrolase/phosphoribosyl-AMP cyclohydrolase